MQIPLIKQTSQDEPATERQRSISNSNFQQQNELIPARRGSSPLIKSSKYSEVSRMNQDIQVDNLTASEDRRLQMEQNVYTQNSSFSLNKHRNAIFKENEQEHELTYNEYFNHYQNENPYYSNPVSPIHTHSKFLIQFQEFSWNNDSERRIANDRNSSRLNNENSSAQGFLNSARNLNTTMLNQELQILSQNVANNSVILELFDSGWLYALNMEDLQLFQKLKPLFIIKKDPKKQISITNRSSSKKQMAYKTFINTNIQPKSAGRIHNEYSVKQKQIQQQYKLMNHFYELLKQNGKAKYMGSYVPQKQHLLQNRVIQIGGNNPQFKEVTTCLQKIQGLSDQQQSKSFCLQERNKQFQSNADIYQSNQENSSRISTKDHFYKYKNTNQSNMSNYFSCTPVQTYNIPIDHQKKFTPLILQKPLTSSQDKPLWIVPGHKNSLSRPQSNQRSSHAIQQHNSSSKVLKEIILSKLRTAKPSSQDLLEINSDTNSQLRVQNLEININAPEILNQRNGAYKKNRSKFKSKTNAVGSPQYYDIPIIHKQGTTSTLLNQSVTNQQVTSPINSLGKGTVHTQKKQAFSPTSSNRSNSPLNSPEAQTQTKQDSIRDLLGHIKEETDESLESKRINEMKRRNFHNQGYNPYKRYSNTLDARREKKKIYQLKKKELKRIQELDQTQSSLEKNKNARRIKLKRSRSIEYKDMKKILQEVQIEIDDFGMTNSSPKIKKISNKALSNANQDKFNQSSGYGLDDVQDKPNLTSSTKNQVIKKLHTCQDSKRQIYGSQPQMSSQQQSMKSSLGQESSQSNVNLLPKNNEPIINDQSFKQEALGQISQEVCIQEVFPSLKHQQEKFPPNDQISITPINENKEQLIVIKYKTSNQELDKILHPNFAKSNYDSRDSNLQPFPLDCYNQLSFGDVNSKDRSNKINFGIVNIVDFQPDLPQDKKLCSPLIQKPKAINPIKKDHTKYKLTKEEKKQVQMLKRNINYYRRQSHLDHKSIYNENKTFYSPLRSVSQLQNERISSQINICQEQKKEDFKFSQSQKTSPRDKSQPQQAKVFSYYSNGSTFVVRENTKIEPQNSSIIEIKKLAKRQEKAKSQLNSPNKLISNKIDKEQQCSNLESNNLIIIHEIGRNITSPKQSFEESKEKWKSQNLWRKGDRKEKPFQVRKKITNLVQNNKDYQYFPALHGGRPSSQIEVRPKIPTAVTQFNFYSKRGSSQCSVNGNSKTISSRSKMNQDSQLQEISVMNEDISIVGNNFKHLN